MNFNKNIKIGSNYIGQKHKTMFIAEIDQTLMVV